MAFAYPTLPPIDREPERDRFRAMLDGTRSERVFALKAAPLCGKSCLVDLLERDCWNRGLLCARLDFRDSKWDYLDLAERLRDQWLRSARRISPDLAETVRAVFAPFTDMVERTRPGQPPPPPVNIVVGSGRIDASRRDRHDVHIDASGDAVYQPPPPGPAAYDQAQARERQRLLTGAFLDCLETLTAHRQAICLLDTFEQADQADREEDKAGQWFHHHVLTTARERGLRNLIVFLAGQDVPDLSGWRNWAYYQDRLDPFTEDACYQVAVCLGLSLPRHKVAAHYRRLRYMLPGQVAMFYSIYAEEVL